MGENLTIKEIEDWTRLTRKLLSSRVWQTMSGGLIEEALGAMVRRFGELISEDKRSELRRHVTLGRMDID